MHIISPHNYYIIALCAYVYYLQDQRGIHNNTLQARSNTGPRQSSGVGPHTAPPPPSGNRKPPAADHGTTVHHHPLESAEKTSTSAAMQPTVSLHHLCYYLSTIS